MQYFALPEEHMLPKVRLARHYDTREEAILKNNIPRTADSYEFGIYLTDGGSITINGNQHPIVCGDVRFLRPGDLVCSEPHYRCYTIFFSFGDQDICFHNSLLDSIPSYFSGNSGQLTLFKEAVHLFVSREPGSVVGLNAIVLQLLMSLYRAASTETQYPPSVQTIIAYLHEHLNEKITLERLGNLTGYSSLHVLRIYKSATGKTPHEYLSGLRMTRARELLINTTLPISEIAAMCGFSSESHFWSFFKKANGITPKRCRQNALHAV